MYVFKFCMYLVYSFVFNFQLFFGNYISVIFIYTWKKIYIYRSIEAHDESLFFLFFPWLVPPSPQACCLEKNEQKKRAPPHPPSTELSVRVSGIRMWEIPRKMNGGG